VLLTVPENVYGLTLDAFNGTLSLLLRKYGYDVKKIKKTYTYIKKGARP